MGRVRLDAEDTQGRYCLLGSSRPMLRLSKPPCLLKEDEMIRLRRGKLKNATLDLITALNEEIEKVEKKLESLKRERQLAQRKLEEED
jgi:hypothetical protein